MKTVFALTLLMSIAASAADLKMTLTGFKNEKGVVRVAVFSDNGAFYKRTEDAAAQLTLTVAQARSFTVPRLNPGTYAVAVIHDENNNGKLDTNFLGMPKEGYAFSNSTGIMPPDFEKAKFVVTAPQTSIAIKIKNFF